jgi:glycyl-tRNA synthetase beta chain
MADHLPLLIELGTEELPPKALPELAQAFYDGVLKALAARRIEVRTDAGELHAGPLYSPRRLAVFLPAVAVQQPQQHSEVPGPYANIGLDADGKPTPALLGFAQKNGLSWEKLDRVTDAKGMRFVARSSRPGAATIDLLAEITAEALKGLPIPKPMRWGSREIAFVRPVHWLVILLGRDVAPGEVLGLKSDRMSRGHRFHHGKGVWLNDAAEYLQALREAYVLADPRERRERVRAEIAAAAREAGGQARVLPELLEEVNCLVEWPKAILCSFETEFLRVPQEALVSTMETNQKFFPVLGADGKLSEQFIGIANLESKDPAEIRKGYERVIRPRFADAKFFFDEDLKQGLASMGDGLKTVTYQAKLGSVADKVARVAALAEAIAPQVGVDPALARRAAELAKNDLQSRMVNEFPELQGIAGRYYAQRAGESPEVSLAIDEAYQPRFAGDDIALSGVGKVLAIAERLDTLAGGFAAGLKPTGNKDPFALRRNALGLARTIIESGFDLDLKALLAKANASLVGKGVQADGDELYDFILDRLRGYYVDKGVPAAHFNAVAERKPKSLYDFDRRIDAIGTFAQLPEAAALAAANKRIGNILKKADIAIPGMEDTELLVEPAERALAEAVEAAYDDTGHALSHGDYVDVLAHLARLRPQVDAFFDAVMVNAEDPALRANRLALLKRLADRLGSVAAIEHLST